MSIEINRTKLKAIARFASDDDTRPVLTGVLVEASKDKVRLVATNGHAIAICDDSTESETEIDKPMSVILPMEIVKQAVKGKTKSVQSPLTLIEPTATGLRTEDGKWHLANCQVTWSFFPVDGNYPDYRAILTQEPVSGEPGQFGAGYLIDFAMAARELDGKRYPTIAHNGAMGMAYVNIGLPDFFGAIMPIRTQPDEIFTTVPEWVKGNGDK